MTTPDPTTHGWPIAPASVPTTVDGDHDMAASPAAELVPNPPDAYSAIFIPTNLGVSASEAFASLQSDTTAAEGWADMAQAQSLRLRGDAMTPCQDAPAFARTAVTSSLLGDKPGRADLLDQLSADPAATRAARDELGTAVTRLCTAVGNIAPCHRGDLHLWQSLALGHAHHTWDAK